MPGIMGGLDTPGRVMDYAASIARADGGFGLSAANEYVGMAFQEAYKHVNNTAFYALASSEMLPFYRHFVQRWDYWQNGLVPDFHNLNNGVVPTHLAKAIVKKVASLIYGGGLMYESVGADEQDGTPQIDEVMQFARDWVRDTHLAEKVQECIQFSAGLGTGCYKLNMDNHNKLWVDVFPFNRAFFDLDAKGNVRRAKFYQSGYNKDADKSKGLSISYGLVEERYFVTDDNGNERSVCKYGIYQTAGKVNNFSACTTVGMNWEQLPKWLQKQIKADYGNIRIGQEQRLPFKGLGVYISKWTASIQSMPQIKFGESVISGIENYLCQYDILSAINVTDMYCGRARVLIPKGFGNRGGANFNAGLDSFTFTEYETLDTKGSTPQFIQAEIRAEALGKLRNTILENICTAIGISPSSFASYLQDTSAARTAREISAEETATTLFVENHRDLIIQPVNEMLADVLAFYGKAGEVVAKFSKAGQTNVTLHTENIIKQYQAGLISLKSAVAELNPDKDQYALAEEVSRIEAEKEAQQSAMQNGLFGDMGGGTDII